MKKAPLLTFDMPHLIEKLKLNRGWGQDELKSMILLKRPDRQMVLTALPRGIEISSFQSSDSVTFQIIEGAIMFHTQNKSVFLKKGQLLTLHEKIKYRINSCEETIFLLTIANYSWIKVAGN
jgi:hypothetical protein